MSLSTYSPPELEQIYRTRFAGSIQYRKQVWEVLARYFSRWIPPSSAVLDLGCGYCEFINEVQAREKYAMDLNPEVPFRLSPGTVLLPQDASSTWDLNSASLDAVFTSNFFEHLPTKSHLEKSLAEAYRCLRGGGRLVALGPNIRHVGGAYWDFFDHHLALTEQSLAEALKKCGFEIENSFSQFLPYTMSGGTKQYPIWTLKAYLKLPLAWRLFGKQFLVVARKPA